MGEVTRLALQHHPADADAGAVPQARRPLLVVHTCFGEERAPDDAPYRAIVHLEADRPNDDHLPDEAIARHRARWQPRTVSVESREQVFWFQEAGERWAAFARVGEVRVVLAASRWDPAGVRLTLVAPVTYAPVTYAPVADAPVTAAGDADTESTTKR